MSDLHDDVMQRLRRAWDSIPLWHHVLLFRSVEDLVAFGAPADVVERLNTAFDDRYEFDDHATGERGHGL